MSGSPARKTDLASASTTRASAQASGQSKSTLADVVIINPVRKPSREQVTLRRKVRPERRRIAAARSVRNDLDAVIVVILFLVVVAAFLGWLIKNGHW